MSPVKVLDPEGALGATPSTLAPPLHALAGRRLGVLDNGKPNAGLLLTTIAARLAARAGAEVALVVEKGTAATPVEPEVLEQLVEMDAVLTGSADCGSCTSWSISDAVELEARGVPTVVLATESFADLARRIASTHGTPVRLTVVEAPLGGIAPAHVVARAERAVDDTLSRLTTNP